MKLAYVQKVKGGDGATLPYITDEASMIAALAKTNAELLKACVQLEEANEFQRFKSDFACVIAILACVIAVVVAAV